jgi:hypothetical protein
VLEIGSTTAPNFRSPGVRPFRTDRGRRHGLPPLSRRPLSVAQRTARAIANRAHRVRTHEQGLRGASRVPEARRRQSICRRRRPPTYRRGCRVPRPRPAYAKSAPQELSPSTSSGRETPARAICCGLAHGAPSHVKIDVVEATSGRSKPPYLAAMSLVCRAPGLRRPPRGCQQDRRGHQ